MKTILIVLCALLGLFVVLILYCALVVASQADRRSEEMHIQWMRERKEETDPPEVTPP